jgi:hypothetical protein
MIFLERIKEKRIFNEKAENNFHFAQRTVSPTLFETTFYEFSKK